MIGHGLNSEGDEIDDSISLFSQRLIENEGGKKNTELILPEADDDTFFDYQSQRSQSSFSERRDGRTSRQEYS